MITKFFTIADWLIEEWEQKFSPLNVRRELEEVVKFLEANPRRRRKNGYQGFIAEWLARECAKVHVAHAERVGARNLL